MTLPENIPTDVPIHFALVLAGAWVCLWLHVPLVVTVLLALLFIVGREAEKAITRPVGTPQDMADTERDVAAGLAGLLAGIVLHLL